MEFSPEPAWAYRHAPTVPHLVRVDTRPARQQRRSYCGLDYLAGFRAVTTRDRIQSVLS